MFAKLTGHIPSQYGDIDKTRSGFRNRFHFKMIRPRGRLARTWPGPGLEL
jgi:hypothetical protein